MVELVWTMQEEGDVDGGELAGFLAFRCGLISVSGARTPLYARLARTGSRQSVDAAHARPRPTRRPPRPALPGRVGALRLAGGGRGSRAGDVQPRALAAATAALAQAPATPPKVGLVLGGGGARGGAHLGVLEVLEEMRVPVACIAATSMGALVGGAYASGVSTKDIVDRVRETDWNSMFDDFAGRDLGGEGGV